MTKLLEAGEICCSGLGDISRKIIGNYILFRIKQELGKHDEANVIGEQLLYFIEDDLTTPSSMR